MVLEALLLPTLEAKRRNCEGNEDLQLALPRERDVVIRKKHPNVALLTIILILGLSASIAVAQSESAPGNTSQRVRRVETDLQRPAPDDETPTNDSSSDDGSRDESPISALESEILALREQIEAASNSEEKARLQFKLVDRLLAEGLKPRAIAELHSMTVEDRFDPQGFYNIGNALARLGESDGAVKSYRKAIEQRKGRYSRALNNLGVVLLRQGRWDEALEVLLTALRIENFHYAEASYNLGRLYAARGETDLAIREWRRTLAVNPEHSSAAEAIAGTRRGRSITVAATPSSTKTIAARTAVRSNSIDERRAGKSERTPSMNTRVLTVDPETYRFLQQARTARDRGRNEEAVRDYRRVISRMGGYFPPANLELGYTLLNLKRNDEALASLLSLAEKDGTEFPISHYHIGRIYEAKGELKLAEECFNRVATSYGDQNAQFLLDLSRVREKLEDFSGAVIAMERYIEIMGRQGQKPDWSDERLSKLREQLQSSNSKQ